MREQGVAVRVTAGRWQGLTGTIVQSDGKRVRIKTPLQRYITTLRRHCKEIEA